MYWFLFLIILTARLSANDSALPAEDTPPTEFEDQRKLIVNNRILARLQDKTISVFDVMKRMDVFFSRNYPQYANSNLHRFQFFSAHWKETLSQMIKNEFLLEDAKKIELKISDADVRELLHERFGPNLMQSLDRFGMSYDEAWQMIYSEIAVQRMVWYRVNSKAVLSVGPQDVKEAFKRYCLEHPPEERWEYQICSIKAPSQEFGKQVAQKALSLLQQKDLSFDGLSEKLSADAPPPDYAISVSKTYEVSSTQISESLKKVLTSLTPGMYSEPISQSSRNESTPVQRIFYLKNYEQKPAPVFEKLSDKLQDGLIEKAIEKESAIYFKKLSQKLGVDEKQVMENLPADFQPFALK